MTDYRLKMCRECGDEADVCYTYPALNILGSDIFKDAYYCQPCADELGLAESKNTRVAKVTVSACREIAKAKMKATKLGNR